MNKKDDVIILSFESSADETSVSIVKNGREVLSNTTVTQINSHKRFGGIVPEVASRHHIEWISYILDESLNKSGLKIEDVDAIAATIGPGLVGSLMIGVMAAKTISSIFKKPFIAVNHLKGHLLSVLLENKEDIVYPALGLLVSGGHTQLVYISEEDNYEVVGETLDDAAGEALDKFGRLMDIDYPAGKKIEELAKLGVTNIELPIAKTNDKFDFSFSGVKSSAQQLTNKIDLSDNQLKNNLISSYQDVIFRSIEKKLNRAIKEYNPSTILFGGGVSANQNLRDRVLKSAKENNSLVFMPEKKYSGDNAAMIGAAAFVEFNKGNFSELNIDVQPNLNL